jgi:hypothetical protein
MPLAPEQELVEVIGRRIQRYVSVYYRAMDRIISITPLVTLCIELTPVLLRPFKFPTSQTPNSLALPAVEGTVESSPSSSSSSLSSILQSTKHSAHSPFILQAQWDHETALLPLLCILFPILNNHDLLIPARCWTVYSVKLDTSLPLFTTPSRTFLGGSASLAGTQLVYLLQQRQQPLAEPKT